MRLIIGGREQGKLSFAVNRYKLSDDEIFDCTQAGLQEMFHAKCVYNLHEYVRRLVRNGLTEEVDLEIELWLNSVKDFASDFTLDEAFDNSDFLDGLISCFRADAIIICDEVGLGIVPVIKEERVYRQAVGRLCCRLAEKADSVERVFCGIAMKIK